MHAISLLCFIRPFGRMTARAANQSIHSMNVRSHPKKKSSEIRKTLGVFRGVRCGQNGPKFLFLTRFGVALGRTHCLFHLPRWLAWEVSCPHWTRTPVQCVLKDVTPSAVCLFFASWLLGFLCVPALGSCARSGMKVKDHVHRQGQAIEEPGPGSCGIDRGV